MSYCRWSSDNGYCDVYVYEDVHGGWTTHVASARYPEGRPQGYMEVFFSFMDAGGDAEAAHVPALEARAAQEEWDEANPVIAIESPKAGESFSHSSPGECADNLEQLRCEGFQVPQYAIDSLREEHCEFCGRGQ